MTIPQKTLIAIGVFWLITGYFRYKRDKDPLKVAAFLLSKEMLFSAALFAATIYTALLIFSLIG